MTEKYYQNIIHELTEALSEQRISFTSTISEMRANFTDTINGLNATIAELLATIVELKAQLGQNSTNSSKPPSSDGIKKPPIKSLRKPSGKKPGGQKGHEGNGLKLNRAPDIREIHEPSRCAVCENAANCVAERVKLKTRNVIDIVVKPLIRNGENIYLLCRGMCVEAFAHSTRRRHMFTPLRI